MKYLDKSLAQEIVDRTMKIIHKNINVMNDKGVILGSGDKSRIDFIHEGALQVIESKAELEIGDLEAERFYGVKAGINFPINFNGEVVGVIGITGSPDDVRSHGELVKMAAEMILQQAVLIDQMQWDERLREELISQLLHGTENLDAHYFERISRLGIDLDVPRVAVIITASDPSKVFEIIRGRFEKEDLYVLRTDHLVLLKAVNVKDANWDAARLINKLETWVASVEKYKDVHCTISIGNYHPTLKGISESYEEARLAAKVGEKIDPFNTFYLYEQYKLPAFLAKANELGMGGEMDPYFHQLKMHDKKGELVETLLAYIEEDGEIQAITEKLFIHRNTLRYRLERIAEVTGKDPRKVKDLLELYLSVLQAQIK